MNINSNLASTLYTNNENIDIVNSTPVVGINNDNVSVKILSYLNEKKRKSINTYDAYLRYYTEFFMFTCNKQISQLTWNDIFNITYSKIDEYKEHLLNSNVKSYYVNQKLFACKALWEKLYHINRNVDLRVLDFEEEDFEPNNYAALNDNEMNLLFEFAETSGYKKGKYTKRMFFEFLYYMGCRKNVALELKWNDIQTRYDHNTGLNVWTIKFKDKGKYITKAINNDFYERILKLKEENKGEKVFHLAKETFEKTFNDFRTKYNLEMKDGKRVTIHSIKKASGWMVQNTFGDLNKTKLHLQHSNPSTTANIYVNVENYTDQASYLIGKNIDMDFFKELSKDELLGLIEMCGKDVQLKMYYKWDKSKGLN